VALRRKLLAEAKLGPLRVLDLFAGEGNIWNELRRTLTVEKYTPVDQAARQLGQIRFKITPRLIEALDGEDHSLSRYNVIDIDAFGEPWAIWQAVLSRITVPTAVFLTRGKVAFGAGRVNLSGVAKESMGIPKEWDIPIKTELLEHADRCSLLQDCPTARITKGYQIRMPRKGSSMDYYGLLVEPKNEKAIQSEGEDAR
jgi:hypothetical protein